VPLISNPKVAQLQQKMARLGKTDAIYYCYRCDSCKRLITKIDVLEARIHGRMNVCPCGSRVMKVTNPKIWEEIFFPRCWRLIAAIYLKRIAPPPPPPTPEEQAEARRVKAQAMAAFERQREEMLEGDPL